MEMYFLLQASSCYQMETLQKQTEAEYEKKIE